MGHAHSCFCLLAIDTTIVIAIAVIAIAANAGPTFVATDAAADTDAIDAIAANDEAAAIIVAHGTVATNVIASRTCSAATGVPMDANADKFAATSVADVVTGRVVFGPAANDVPMNAGAANDVASCA